MLFHRSSVKLRCQSITTHISILTQLFIFRFSSNHVVFRRCNSALFIHCRYCVDETFKPLRFSQTLPFLCRYSFLPNFFLPFATLYHKDGLSFLPVPQLNYEILEPLSFHYYLQSFILLYEILRDISIQISFRLYRS